MTCELGGKAAKEIGYSGMVAELGRGRGANIFPIHRQRLVMPSIHPYLRHSLNSSQLNLASFAFLLPFSLPHVYSTSSSQTLPSLLFVFPTDQSPLRSQCLLVFLLHLQARPSSMPSGPRLPLPTQQNPKVLIFTPDSPSLVLSAALSLTELSPPSMCTYSALFVLLYHSQWLVVGICRRTISDLVSSAKKKIETQLLLPTFYAMPDPIFRAK